MADKQDCDRYAAELAQRFEQLTRWAIENWPHRESPLLQSDFEASRKEFGAILGVRLNEGRADMKPAQAQQPEYRPVNPAPWP